MSQWRTFRSIDPTPSRHHLLSNISAISAVPAGLQAPSPRAIPILQLTYFKAISERYLWAVFGFFALFKLFFELTYFLNPVSDDIVKGRMTRQHCRQSNWIVRKNTKQVKIKTTTLILRQGDLSTTSCQYWVAKPMRAQQEEKRATHLQLSALQHGGGGEIICGELDGGKYMRA